MFERARAARTQADRLQAIATEIEGLLRAGTFRLTDVLNADEDLQIMALDYLHGRSETSRKQPVTVQIEVLEPIVKHHSEAIRVGGRTQTIGGSERVQHLADGRPLRTVTDTGVHLMSTEQAVWFLYNYGAGVVKNDIRPENTRRAWCREASKVAVTSPARPRAAAAG